MSQNEKTEEYLRLYSESDPVKALITTRAVDTSPMYLTVSDAKKLPENDPCHRDGKEAIYASRSKGQLTRLYMGHGTTKKM
jgi:hypothetical protein